MSKAIVLYSSRGGNTEKVARQIAEGLGADIGKRNTVPLLDDYDLVVAGSWCVMGMLAPAGVRVFRRINRKTKTPKKAALFFTSGTPEEIHPMTKDSPQPKTIKKIMFDKMEKILSRNKKITILGDRFYCVGASRMKLDEEPVDRVGHPSDEELAEAKAFGERLKAEL